MPIPLTKYLELLDRLNVVTGIYEKIKVLSEHPRLGQRYQPICDREVREILYGHYRIEYLARISHKFVGRNKQPLTLPELRSLRPRPFAPTRCQ